MTGQYVVSGGASGIGQAVVARLRAQGGQVFVIDLREGDVLADLSTPEGRAHAIAATKSLIDGRLDGLVLCAGLGPHVPKASAVLGVNYFGAVALLDGLESELAATDGGNAVVISSVAAAQMPWKKNPIAGLLEAGEEAGAVAALSQMGEMAGQIAYAASKNALTVSIRKRAVAWGAKGIRLNAVGPGVVETPLLEGGLAHPVYGPAIRNFTCPLGRSGRPDDIAALVSFLLSGEAGFIHGAQIFIDGGADAMARPTEF
jgi:NAD(P)-dependent dehydrogenase (short-subunit alcohol dehydrogenase family)